ncbi:helix-turn-helix domain-containing protein [Streptosporangium saharense]|uniref:helix-turn-helix domain-containing protein n=1 Tax=Streptosporangium saharense TaxID=1706840 RepID=UPI0033212BCF
MPRLSVRALARRANRGKTHVAYLENGRRNPSLAVATALDRALRADGELLASWFWEGVGPSPTPARFCHPLCSFATSTTQTTPKRSSSIP